MNRKNDIVDQLIDPGVIAVVRSPTEEDAYPLAEALIQGGVIAVEITMTTPNAFRVIRRLARENRGRALIGVGSVIDVDTCEQAVAAGAQFVVSPIAQTDLVAVAHEAERAVMLGAFTPTEAQRAHESGADFVKLFPADSLGPSYIKALLAPLPHLKIVPTGGVTAENLGDFFRAGCAAVGAGSSLIGRSVMAQRDWPALERAAARFAAAAREARGRRNSA